MGKRIRAHRTVTLNPTQLDKLMQIGASFGERRLSALLDLAVIEYVKKRWRSSMAVVSTPRRRRMPKAP